MVDFSEALTAIVQQVFDNAEASRKEQKKEKELLEEESEVEVIIEEDPKKEYDIPENVSRTLCQLIGYKVDLNNFDAVSKELRDLGDLDVLTWVCENQDAYAYFVKKKAWEV